MPINLYLEAAFPLLFPDSDIYLYIVPDYVGFYSCLFCGVIFFI